jgi:hypothetical protein
VDRILFVPVSVAGGVVAGLIGKKLFTAVWGTIDHEEAPRPEHRDVPIGKLLVALAIQGALFALVRGIVDHGSRQAYASLTGSWPGEEHPEPQ